MRILFFLCCLLPCLVAAQSEIFYLRYSLRDAIQLRNCLQPQEVNGQAVFVADARFETQCLPILLRYAAPDQPLDLQTLYSGNPFIGPDATQSVIVLPDPDALALSQPTPFEKPQPLFSTSLFNSGFVVADLAEGVANFLSTRTREELTLTFFRRFQKALTNNPEFEVLFPASIGLLNLIDQDIYQFTIFLESLREAFLQDLKALPVNVRDFLVVHPELAGLGPDKVLLVDDAFRLSELLINGATPQEIVAFLGRESLTLAARDLPSLPDSLRKTLGEVSNVLRTIDLLTQGLRRSAAPDSLWLSAREVTVALSDPLVMHLYLGLLWQQTRTYREVPAAELQQWLRAFRSAPEVQEGLRKQLQSMSRLINRAETALDALQNQPDTAALNFTTYAEYIGSIRDLLKEGVTAYGIQSEGANAALNAVDRLLTIFGHANDLYFQARQQQYISAITTAVQIFEAVSDESLPISTEMLRYGTFVASIAEADSAEDIDRTLELFALPAGSSLVKKYQRFSVSINAYTGLSIGREEVNAAEIGTATVLAVAAPIGLGFNWGLRRAGSIGVFIPLLDVGALTAFRFDDELTEDLPELALENLFSPGALVTYGFGADLPITLSAGFQRGPNLRELTPLAQLEFDEITAYRFLISLAVDIPIANLYSR